MKGNHDALPVYGKPLRPRIWENDWGSATPTFGLRCIERRWRREPPSLVRPREESSEMVSVRNVSYPWGPPPPRRTPPAASTSGGPLPLTPSAPSDTIDLLAVPEHLPSVPWERCLTRIQDSGVDRVHKALAWRILHCAAWCGAYKSYIRSENNPLPESEQCCPRGCCQHHPETLTHLFLTCPVSSRVIRWVCDLWPALTGGTRPPSSAAIFLGDDQRVWDPGTYGKLWTRLRLVTLYAIWAASCRRRNGKMSNSASIAATVVFGLRHSVLQDWHRTQEDVRRHSSILSDWFRGRDTCLSIQEFQSLWGPSGGVYLFVASPLSPDRPSLKINLTCTHPIRVPLGGEHP